MRAVRAQHLRWLVVILAFGIIVIADGAGGKRPFGEILSPTRWIEKYAEATESSKALRFIRKAPDNEIDCVSRLYVFDGNRNSWVFRGVNRKAEDRTRVDNRSIMDITEVPANFLRLNKGTYIPCGQLAPLDSRWQNRWLADVSSQFLAAFAGSRPIF
jgi:hypothetical protein